ncbi:phosphoribosylamine--glycine ligase [Mahella australiensis 50-1 BON]|uniref:Phosphoribosylamine--glycine ligase n=1 Tax=Mahella australiensis (strain DSM 15567 / CIP 107919 / 50-1 BON) TaxID=697281 RepID=F3ZZI5_MAHA5|nr:phosphoribosylamine--glycine ligase [Mahella australiensis 50-1 BON]
MLIIGSGGREHALAWKIAQSHEVDEIYCAPGNGGISDIARCIDIKATDIDGVVNFAKQNAIDLTVVAPDDPLAMGMVDALEAVGCRAFGPRRDAAAIEASKAFAKQLMHKYNIPTAKYEVFDDYEKAAAYVEKCPVPIVIKADGLALGKGVTVAMDRQDALAALKSIMLDKVFKEAGSRVVIEQYLTGHEVSVLAFSDGKTVVPMISAQDHKRAYDGNKGPNTGGMGAIAPSPYYTPDVKQRVEREIIYPTIAAMAAEGRLFKGVLYFGLMLTDDGPKVLEYNARFGDPEAQAVLPLLKSDLVGIMEAIIDGRLDEIKVAWYDKAAACIVLASGGYPAHYTTGYPIMGLDDIDDPDVIVFHAGTKKEGNIYYTAGGRVLGVTAVADNLDTALGKAYESVQKIKFKDMHYRKDIGRV